MLEARGYVVVVVWVHGNVRGHNGLHELERCFACSGVGTRQGERLRDGSGLVEAEGRRGGEPRSGEEQREISNVFLILNLKSVVFIFTAIRSDAAGFRIWNQR